MRLFVTLVTIAVLGACTNEIDQSTRPENIAGNYHLTTYGGASLPATRQVDTFTVQILSGDLVLGTDHSWNETLVVRSTSTTQGSSQTFSQLGAGSWTIIREYAYLAFNDTRNAYQFSGTASGGTIALRNVDGTELIYRR